VKKRLAGKPIARLSLKLETSAFGNAAWPLSSETIFQTISSIMIALLQSGSISLANFAGQIVAHGPSQHCSSGCRNIMPSAKIPARIE
jgi:hypothetical protein